MKKMKRIIAAILLLAICLVATGCISVKELRQKHGTWADDTCSVIHLNGSEYKRLPAWDVELNFTYGDLIHVSEKDVPLLLATNTYYGERFDISEDGIFLESYTYDEMLGNYFCRSDYYDTLVAEYQKGVEYTRYGYTYFNLETARDDIYLLTEEQETAFNRVLGNKALLFTPSSNEDYDYGYVYGPYIEIYSEDLLFRKTCCTIGYDENGGCILIVDEADSSWHYKVPAELNRIFEEMLVAYESY